MIFEEIYVHYFQVVAHVGSKHSEIIMLNS